MRRRSEDGKPFQLKRNINIDQIRAMQQRLHTRPTLGSRRVIIIDPADDLEKSAANALLKSLEEPPQGTHFLLVAHRPGRLLATIRSRCRMVRFARLSTMRARCNTGQRSARHDAATRAAAIAAAGGSPGVALEFVELDLKTIHTADAGYRRKGRSGLHSTGQTGRCHGRAAGPQEAACRAGTRPGHRCGCHAADPYGGLPALAGNPCRTRPADGANFRSPISIPACW
jgi:DNA polymerase III subunit delta'